MEAIPCPACKGHEARKLTCQFCGARGDVPDGPGALPPATWWPILKYAVPVVIGLVVIYLSFLFPRDRDMDLLRSGLQQQEGIAVKNIDHVKDEHGGWSFGTVTTEDGARYPLAATWTVDRTQENWVEWRVQWVVGTDPGRVERIEKLKAKK